MPPKFSITGDLIPRLLVIATIFLISVLELNVLYSDPDYDYVDAYPKTVVAVLAAHIVWSVLPLLGRRPTENAASLSADSFKKNVDRTIKRFGSLTLLLAIVLVFFRKF